MTYIGMALGAAFGAFLAYRRKGNRLDMLQYAAGFGIIFGLLAAVIGVIILRMM